jgi:predicted methyltransferase
VRTAVEEAGFILEDSSRLLHNHADKHEDFVFADDVRGQTDRFLLRFTKPGK